MNPILLDALQVVGIIVGIFILIGVMFYFMSKYGAQLDKFMDSLGAWTDKVETKHNAKVAAKAEAKQREEDVAVRVEMLTEEIAKIYRRINAHGSAIRTIEEQLPRVRK